ncbi:C40 family peptidase [Lutispora thermophila]|uniref:Variant SH3 domain-containing protein n=1 Tax=Lutispora thermophila DSM 19022 TaxID=1122184 RepID=A0A1M6FJX5_9FIRM|nr:SH3 domain-containing C40 family peptidase [Lutispora thermophila]SHI97932.1 Variant SH3 domain-containing protein [Lutispora thermophila DSM 19022]
MCNKLAITKKNVIPLKLNPSFDSEVADESLYGMVLQLEEKLTDGWYKVKTHYDYEGFVHENDMLIDDERALEWSKMAEHYIIHNIADVMAEPKYQSYQLITLVRGDFIHLTGKEEGRWCEVELIDKTKGWVQKEFCKKMPKFDLDKEEDVVRKSLLDIAFLYMGTQYRWGGKSTMGIDCSGFVSMAYMLNGIIIYRDARLKEEYMKSISIEEVKPGDALYFPGHIAMYIGDGKYIHSTGSSGRVVINSLNPEDEDYREDLHKSLYAVGTVFGRK